VRESRPLSWLISLALIVTLGPDIVSPIRPTFCTGTHAPGAVLVGFRDQGESAFHQSRARPSQRWLNAESIVATIPEIEVTVLHVPAGMECTVLETLRHDPRVAFAELDYTVRATETRFLTPNDPGWVEQWGLARISAPMAWWVATGTPDVVIAILDSGIQLDHEDLADRLWVNPGEVPGNQVDDDGNGKVDDFQGWHFYHAWNGQAFVPEEDNQVTDEHGHGTHVAGITGAAFNNKVGVAGLAGGSQLMIVKVLDQQGEGRYSDVAQSIIYAVDNGAQVINLSFGGTSPSQTLQEAVNYAHARGVLVVAASGNDGGPVLYPAVCEHVLSVAATDQDDNRASFSNYGPETDVAAPGVSIYSTGWPGDSRADCTSGYCRKSGTSGATPHVAGLAALMWSARPDLTVAQVTGIVTRTAADVNTGTLTGWDEFLGWGRIEAGRALSATVHTGVLQLVSSRYSLAAGESATITATLPITSGTANLFNFAASGGNVSPTTKALNSGVVTTSLIAGTKAGTATVTGTTGELSGTLFLRLLPGPVVSATLNPASWEVMVGHSTVATLTATDGFGNPPLDGTFVSWIAKGGIVTPARSPFDMGTCQTAFIAGAIPGTAVITAKVGSGPAIAVTVEVYTSHRYRYLPIILRGDGCKTRALDGGRTAPTSSEAGAETLFMHYRLVTIQNQIPDSDVMMDIPLDREGDPLNLAQILPQLFVA
jgi:thermitase